MILLRREVITIWDKASSQIVANQGFDLSTPEPRAGRFRGALMACKNGRGPVRLPPEIWMCILSCLPLEILWQYARPVSSMWNDLAQEIARLLLYKASQCEVSTLVNEVGQFQHYEGDF